MLPVLALLVAMFALGRFLHVLGREYVIVFSANLSMITLFLTAVIFRRTREWRVLPLLLLFLGMTIQLSMVFAIEVLGLHAPRVCLWLMANPLFAPTLLGFASVLYLWRVFQAQAELARKERMMAERLQLAQKFESLGAMAGGIAHDFNNLLTTIQGNVALARYDTEAGSELAGCLNSIEAAADRAARITQQMLDFSGHGKFSAEPFGLDTLVHDLRELIDSFVPRHTPVTYQTEDQIPKVCGDKSQIGQVIVNLVTNAVEAIGPNPGEITVEVSRIDADQELLATGVVSPPPPPPGEYAVLRVTDTGDGIPADVLPRMFDPFVTTKETGRGMGLPAALGIVRGHHGTIMVDSTPGRGTAITVLLPAHRRQAAPDGANTTSEEFTAELSAPLEAVVPE